MGDFSAHRGNDSKTWKERTWVESPLNAQEEILPVGEFKFGSWSKVWEQWSERMADRQYSRLCNSLMAMVHWLIVVLTERRDPRYKLLKWVSSVGCLASSPRDRARN